ncbi:arylacetamide deacetylase-like [Tubulanus polymorphus]|uniref:arylacetamide deacetylase-like n=1 Tax=Tubulanus polymorphus TaxID=672921 RepID=UPI003DA344AC
MGYVLNTIILVPSVLVVLLAYLYYEPLPQDTESPHTVRMMGLGYKIAFHLADFSSFLGISTFGTTFRIVLDKYSRILAKLEAPIDDEDKLEVTDTEFNDVKVRLYDPRTTGQNRPGLIFMHGGGWLSMTVDDYDRPIRMLSAKTGIFIVSVSYRLTSTENPFPTSLDDCKVASTYFLQNSQKYRVDPKRIAIGGDSAGGNLAAAVNLQLLEVLGLNKPKLQVLIYPALQAFDLNTPSYQLNAKGTITSKNAMKIWSHYADPSMKYLKHFNAKNHHVSLASKTSHKYAQYVSRSLLPDRHNKNTKPFSTEPGDQLTVNAIESTILDPSFSPLLADNLKGLPNTFMLTCEHDLLRDDGFMYAVRLKKAGIPVEHVHMMNGIHGSLFFDPKAEEELIKYLRKYL